MKKKYKAPTVEFERYKLDSNIASNCAIVVSNGPAMGNHTQCSDYISPYSTRSAEAIYNVQFYEDTNCDCDYSASAFGYWTS